MGLLQPLSITTLFWGNVSMNFIKGLPLSCSVDCILVVVERLSTYGHFVGVQYPCMTKEVGVAFGDEIIHLHGISSSILSDVIQYSLVHYGLSYFELWNHPKINGQTKLLNRCYLAMELLVALGCYNTLAEVYR